MSYTPIGLDTAKEVLEAMRLVTARFWFEWESRYPNLTQGRKEELQKELQELLEACRAAEGDWEHIDYDPTTGDGLDRAVFVKVWQDSIDEPVRPVAIWLKTNASATSWSRVWPVSVPVADDHQVGVSTADIAASKWGPLASKTRGDNITITAHVETDPILGEQVVFSGVPAAPDANGAWLYTARVPDTQLRDPVRCLLAADFRPLLLQPVKCLIDIDNQGGAWSPVYNPVAFTLAHSTVGEVFGLDEDHNNSLSLNVGDRVWVRGEYNQVGPWSGIYIVATKGSGTEQAVLTKAPFYDYVIGSCFEVVEDYAYQKGLWTCYRFTPDGNYPQFNTASPLPEAVDGCGFGTWWEQI